MKFTLQLSTSVSMMLYLSACYTLAHAQDASTFKKLKEVTYQ